MENALGLNFNDFAFYKFYTFLRDLHRVYQRTEFILLEKFRHGKLHIIYA